MKQIGYGVLNAAGKPAGIWPVSLQHASDHVRRRRAEQRIQGDTIVPVFIGEAVKPLPVLVKQQEPDPA